MPSTAPWAALLHSRQPRRTLDPRSLTPAPTGCTSMRPAERAMHRSSTRCVGEEKRRFNPASANFSLVQFHHALLEVHLEEGALVCPETGERAAAWRQGASRWVLAGRRNSCCRRCCFCCPPHTGCTQAPTAKPACTRISLTSRPPHAASRRPQVPRQRRHPQPSAARGRVLRSGGGRCCLSRAGIACFDT